jgi:glucarate dehydratase
MKIVDVKTTPVTVLMEAPLRWSMGVEYGTTRTIIELVTDDGLIGVGETYGGASTAHRIQESRPLFIGTDPLEVGRIVKRFEVFRVTSEQMARAAEMKYVAAGIEMACWDLVGKILNKPCSALWGGADRSAIPFVAYLFYRDKGPDGVGGEDTPEAIVERYGALVDRYGFEGLKLKGGVLDPATELETVAALRQAYGDRIKFLRFDPNQAWSVETSVRFLNKMVQYDLEYVEDPTWNIEGMALVRERVPIPLASNQALISFEQFPPAVHRRSVDVVLVDLYFWGGITQAKKVATICETFNFGLAMHSDRELGVGTAAGLHFVASTPQVSHYYDTHYHDQVDDVITNPHTWHNGHMEVPTGPGLGVELDRDKVEKYHRLYLERGDAVEFFDPRRPQWTPHLPLW